MPRFLRDQSGATAIEYSVICALILLVCLAAITLVGDKDTGLWSGVDSNVTPNLKQR